MRWGGHPSSSICIGMRWRVGRGVTTPPVVLLAVVCLALAVPGVSAEQSKGPLRRSAVLVSESPCTWDKPVLGAFLHGLPSLGYRDADNVALECRSAER